MEFEWVKLEYTYNGKVVESKWVKVPKLGDKKQDEEYERFLVGHLAPKLSCSEVGRSKTKPTGF